MSFNTTTATSDMSMQLLRSEQDWKDDLIVVCTWLTLTLYALVANILIVVGVSSSVVMRNSTRYRHIIHMARDGHLLQGNCNPSRPFLIEEPNDSINTITIADQPNYLSRVQHESPQTNMWLIMEKAGFLDVVCSEDYPETIVVESACKIKSTKGGDLYDDVTKWNLRGAVLLVRNESNTIEGSDMNEEQQATE
ncbi:hypothetical protein ANCCEY_00832 [Ancylostoma ceylanicum]|uniref:Uncharacterized protein n=1 Tax=Ancylostoma ceylanicum TaxID=53326 RepID=A0A0D6M778_9BILA|nr:hypothetical protein ANCCEY_00832 [Ancylostoma ceylanicum]